MTKPRRTRIAWLIGGIVLMGVVGFYFSAIDQIRIKWAFDNLFEAMEKEDSGEIFTNSQFLASYGKKVDSRVEYYFASKDDIKRYGAKEVLLIMGKRALPIAERSLVHSNLYVQINGLQVLSHISGLLSDDQSQLAKQFVIPLLDEKNTDVQVEAINTLFALGKIRKLPQDVKNRMITILLGQIHNQDYTQRSKKFYQLGRLAEESHPMDRRIQIHLALLKGNWSEVGSGNALRDMGERGISELVSLLGTKHRETGARYLHFNELVEALKDRREKVRNGAFQTFQSAFGSIHLRDIKSLKPYEPLINLLEDTDRLTRARTAVLLVRVPKLTEDLREKCQDILREEKIVPLRWNGKTLLKKASSR